MKEYRNSIRSKRMIKRALVDILKTEDLTKVTVKMIVDKADLSRNTFYAHYQDIYSIIDELQEEFIRECMKYLDEAIENKSFDEGNTLLFFNNMTRFIDANLDEVNILLKTDNSADFIDKLKNLLISRVLETTKYIVIKNPTGYMLFLDVLFCGALDLIKLYTNNKINLTLEDLAVEVNKIFQTGYRSYI